MGEKSTYEEYELVRLLREKDESAYSYLYDHYSGSLFGVINQIISDRELCYDVLQETFINVWRRIETYNEVKGRLFTWMLHIARNAAIDKVRSKNYQQTLRHQTINSDDNFEPSVRPGVDDVGLKKVLFRLKEEQRSLIDLSFYKGFTHEQIATAMHIPLGTVKTRIRSALIELRSILKTN